MNLFSDQVDVRYLLQLLGLDVDLLLQGAVRLLQLQSLFVATVHLLLHLSLAPFLGKRAKKRTVGEKIQIKLTETSTWEPGGPASSRLRPED